MKNPIRLLYLLVILRFVLPFLLVDPSYQLHRDEYLYLAEGKHVAWGFMEVPPMLSFMAWVSHLFGATMFWVKFWPALFGSLTLLLMGKLIIKFGGRHFAIFLAFIPFVCTGFIRLFHLFHPNFLDVFFWTLNAYALIRFVQTRGNGWLYLFGVSVGLGMLSKYSVAFYTVSLLGGLLLTSQRTIFLNKHLYFAAGIALLIMLPNSWWQYQHRFPLFYHMEELKETQLKYIDPSSFLKGQIMMLLPCILLWVAGLWYSFTQATAKPYRFIGWSYIIVIALLAWMNGKSYYAVGVYPVLLAFGAYYIERITLGRNLFRIIIPGISIVLGVYAMPLHIPTKPPAELAKWYEDNKLNKMGGFKWEDHQYHPLPQDFADMIGWRELAEKTAAVYKQLPDSVKAKTFVYCRGYYTAGALNYHASSVGLPVVYSDNASFLFWMPDQYPFRHLLMVAKRMPDKDDVVFQQFEKVTVKDSIQMPLFRETGTKIFLFENGNDSLQYITEWGVRMLKSRFDRLAD